ncbi:hypothetical protein ACFL6S_30845 [Candidatus Poribacteria bacterium]
MPVELAVDLLILIVSAASANTGVADDAHYSEFLGKIDLDQEQFAKALEGRHKSYDPEEKMVFRSHSGGYHYHTGYKGNIVHPTRDSLNYAIDCLDSVIPDLIQRGIEILDRVVALQDTDRESRTFGIWSWYLEEPLDKMDSPDFNWADFCSVQLLQAELRHREKLPADVEQRVRQAIMNACFSIRRRNVGPGYTNIALMSTYVCLVTGDLFDDEDLLNYGRERLERFYQYILRHGCFTEFNSPTYSMVALRELGRMLRDVKDEDCLKKIAVLYRLAWTHIGRHFHEPTRQWAGPNSRAYRDIEGSGLAHFVQRATDNQVQFIPPEELPFDGGYALLPLKCPQESAHYFKPLGGEARQEIEIFFRGKEPLPEEKGDEVGDLPLVGTTEINPRFALGSVNRLDFWNQRRPLIMHCGTWKKLSYARLRFLHDDYDYSSAMFFSVQWGQRVLVGINFATDYGDKHVSLDKVKNATIQAEDLRLRLELGGDLNSLQLPENWKDDGRITVQIGDYQWVHLKVNYAEFGNLPLTYEVGREKDRAWVDVIIYHGETRSINFAELNSAVIGLALEIDDRPFPDSFDQLEVTVEDGRLAQKWNTEVKRLSLSIPIKPDKVGQLQKQPVTLIDGKAPWELAQPSLKR